jgi:YggT family protein
MVVYGVGVGLFGPDSNAKGCAVFHPREFSMRAILDVILLALNLYVWILIAAAVMSWLVAFNVINTRNDFVRAVWDFLYRITEPVLRPIRNVLPNLGGIDISPIILLLLIFFIQRVITHYIYPSVF